MFIFRWERFVTDRSLKTNFNGAVTDNVFSRILFKKGQIKLQMFKFSSILLYYLLCVFVGWLIQNKRTSFKDFILRNREENNYDFSPLSILFSGEMFP